MAQAVSVPNIPDYWAAFGAYTVLLVVAELPQAAPVAVALAWGLALTMTIWWVNTMTKEQRAPFGGNPFWK